MVEKGKENYQRICDLYKEIDAKKVRAEKKKRIEEGE